MTVPRRAALAAHARPVLALLAVPAVAFFASGATRGVAAQAADTTVVGPAHGTVVVVGGGAMGPDINARFIAAAGGPDALIIDVPNAGGGSHYDDSSAGAQRLRAAGARNVRVLFTTDRKVADSDSFVALLKHAGGVWFDGGRQYRLVDAYGGTKTERAFHDVLARGGVVGGSSAGATILGDFLVRGAPSNDNTIMDYPGYGKVGFAFLRGVAIDQHVVARERLPDLADSIMPRYPEMLGMSEDEGTAWIVRGDTATIVGRNKAFVYGGHDPNDPGKPFLTLHPGDRYNLATRRLIHRASDDAPFARAFVDSLFERYAGGEVGEGGEGVEAGPGRAGGVGGADRPGGMATVLVARNGEVFVDTSYGVPPQERFMPTTTLPQFSLDSMSAVFAALCDQLPAPPAELRSGPTRSAAAREAAERWRRMTPLQRCLTRDIARPVGFHRTVADSVGVRSDVDELYRFELGLEDPHTWPDVDRARGWTAETHGGVTWLTAYGLPGGRRAAFIRIPDRRAVVIVLTDDDAADARGIASRIAERMLR